MKLFNKVLLTIATVLFVFTVSTVQAQKEKSQSEMDKKQDEIQNLHIKAYSIIDLYPNVEYTYEYKDGKVTEVQIIGIPDLEEKENLATLLIKLETLKSDLVNQKDINGIYYVTETEPEPEDGYRDLYRDLQSNLDYPETAKEYGVEGTVFVKFIVESNGSIKNIKATNNIDTPFEVAKKDMIKEAKKAVKATSGDWEPAKVGNVPVDQWVYLPVKFDLKSSGYTIDRN
jgi:TonB family protein